ncbi:bile salt-activated lipase-like isoform X2 [Pomacea canaliculata]|uniref:bile salt-activated lipase-like isoform X2 n=1 Tax=Pomacea canaliculata TaxID=400727 RepID=UPI000D7389A2|nr:bile salt-activated lipase-like isoform X2 [Pomacea canaliculata]
MLLYLLVVSVISVTLTRSQNTSTTSTPPVVQTQLGAISGRMLTAKNGRQYEAFRGIPYARPPVGDLRFSKPQPHPAFDQGRFDAGQFGNICWQSASILLQFTESTMSEDCLFLNVFRSSGTSQRNLLPVFVFIHGGAFVWGSSDIYSMGGLVTKGNIIVVTLNYRLGALGFLSTGDPTLPGNYGLWDQHLAIQWVKNNIQAFNGDPDKITIGGESAGSACVAYQTLTPLSRGLFARAILQSGAATSSWALQRKPLDQAQKLALNLTCPSPRSTTSTGDAAIIADFLSCVRRASPQQILLASSQQTTLARALIDYGFIPTVDGEFVRKNPADMLNDNEYLQQIGFYDRDYLSGVVNNEGGTLSTLVLQLTSNDSVILKPEFYDLDLVPLVIEQKFGNTSAVVEEVVRFFYTYPRYSDIALLDKKQVLDTAGDAGFYVPLIEFARAVARGRSSSRRNLVYLFEHYPTYFSDGYLGTPHSYEMMYEFDIDWFLVNASLWTVDDERLREVFMSVIVDFVKSGNPQIVPRSSSQDCWTDFNLIDESYLSIKANSSSIQHHIRPRETSLWLDLLPTLLDPAFNQTNHSTSHVPTLSELIG